MARSGLGNVLGKVLGKGAQQERKRREDKRLPSAGVDAKIHCVFLHPAAVAS
jgi:hypothetical protein